MARARLAEDSSSWIDRWLRFIWFPKNPNSLCLTRDGDIEYNHAQSIRAYKPLQGERMIGDKPEGTLLFKDTIWATSPHCRVRILRINY